MLSFGWWEAIQLSSKCHTGTQKFHLKCQECHQRNQRRPENGFFTHKSSKTYVAWMICKNLFETLDQIPAFLLSSLICATCSLQQRAHIPVNSPVFLVTIKNSVIIMHPVTIATTPTPTPTHSLFRTLRLPFLWAQSNTVCYASFLYLPYFLCTGTFEGSVCFMQARTSRTKRHVGAEAPRRTFDFCWLLFYFWYLPLAVMVQTSVKVHSARSLLLEHISPFLTLI